MALFAANSPMTIARQFLYLCPLARVHTGHAITTTHHRRNSMAQDHVQSGAVPTQPITTEQRAHLAKAMLVTPQALEHLRKMGMFKARGAADVPDMMPEGCCKPDGGTCCPNAK
jgi:hypothetical protein